MLCRLASPTSESNSDSRLDVAATVVEAAGATPAPMAEMAVLVSEVDCETAAATAVETVGASASRNTMELWME